MQEKGGVTLYSSEWSIMECLWERSPLTIVGVWHAVKGKTGWSKSTVNTLLGRMLKKGLIRYEDGAKQRNIILAFAAMRSRLRRQSPYYTAHIRVASV